MTSRKWGAIASAVALGVTPVGNVAAQSVPSSAEQVHRLGIMLMVGSLVCRSDDTKYWSTYERFAVRHSTSINSAYWDLNAEFEASHGVNDAADVMDRISVRMANEYGQGHPWMDCAELGNVTANLADYGNHSDLLSTAQIVLGEPPLQANKIVIAAAE